MARQLLFGAAVLALVTVALWQRQGISAQATRTEQLYAGCNNIAITHEVGTSLSTVTQGLTGTLVSIFRYDNAQARFFGWAPDVPDYAVDYQAVVQRLEPVFVCMSSAGELVQPEADVLGLGSTATTAAGSTATPLSGSVGTPSPTATTGTVFLGATATASAGATGTPSANATGTPSPTATTPAFPTATPTTQATPTPTPSGMSPLTPLTSQTPASTPASTPTPTVTPTPTSTPAP